MLATNISLAQRFIKMFQQTLLPDTFQACLIQSMVSHPITLRPTLVKPPHLCLGFPNGFFISGILINSTYIADIPPPLNSLDLIILKHYVNSTNHQVLHFGILHILIHFFLLGSKYTSQYFLSNTLKLCIPLDFKN